jgi:hypothetical protein
MRLFQNTEWNWVTSLAVGLRLNLQGNSSRWHVQSVIASEVLAPASTYGNTFSAVCPRRYCAVIRSIRALSDLHHRREHTLSSAYLVRYAYRCLVMTTGLYSLHLLRIEATHSIFGQQAVAHLPLYPILHIDCCQLRSDLLLSASYWLAYVLVQVASMAQVHCWHTGQLHTHL